MEEFNYCHGILIHNLRGNLCIRDAVKSIEESVSILSSSVLSAFMNKFGVNIVFDGYEPFHKAVMKGVLLVNDIPYQIYPMVTDMTVIGAFPFLDERTLKSLMKNIAPVLFVYRERDLFSGKFNNNYRVTICHPEIYDIVNEWTFKSLRIPGNCTPLQIALFCRLCRRNGHTRHQCSKRFQADDIKITELIKQPVKRPLKTKRNTKDEIRNPKVCFRRLIPPESHITVPQLRNFLFRVRNEKSSKNMCKKAELYPKGISILLQHLKTVVEYNLKDMSNRHSHERRFIIWMDSLVGKINEELSKKYTKECSILNSKPGTSNKPNEMCSSINESEHVVLPSEPENSQQNIRRFSSKLSSGFLAAIRCSKGVLKSCELKAFLIHVKGKVHVRQTAQIYSTEVNPIIEQLEMIVKKHYQGMKTITLAHKEVTWLNDIIGRLKSHENCKICQNS